MKKNILAILLLLPVYVMGQSYSAEQLDSIYNEYLYLKAPHLVQNIEQMPKDNLPLKCGLGTINFVQMNRNLFGTDKQTVINKVAQRVPKQTSIVSPGGFFRIHFNTTGNNIPRYNLTLTPNQNANLIAEALDSSYNFEVVYLGYPAPPSDDTSGGDNLYDVYIEELGSGLYGYTEYESEVTPGSNKFTSFMVIDNDYAGSFASTGISGARVTVAHEFHHAIQGGNYIFRESDRFFYEITSTAMEEFVFDSVNDYYAYMSSYFQSPGNSFSSNNGYNLAIWNIFLKDRFGFEILKRQWEMMPQMRAISAIASSLAEFNSSLRAEFNKFGIWTYYTNNRRIPGSYFEEAQSYPLLRTGMSRTFTPPSDSINGNSYPVANNFFNLVDNSKSPSDTVTVLISNSNMVSGINSPATQTPFSYVLRIDSVPGSVNLAPGYFAVFNPDDPQNWAVSEFINRQLVREDTARIEIPKTVEDFVFPNPFVMGKSGHENIYFSVQANPGDEVLLNVYTSGMELVYASKEQVFSFNGYKVIRWNGIADNLKYAASGVYIYAIKSGDDIYKGKVVIFND